MRWMCSGTISFGLLGVPVDVYSARESNEQRFHFLHSDSGDLDVIRKAS